jgi:hypothetical protein
MTKAAPAQSALRSLDVLIGAARKAVEKDGTMNLDTLSSALPDSDAGACRAFDGVLDAYQTSSRVTTQLLRGDERVTRTTWAQTYPDRLDSDQTRGALGAMIAAKKFVGRASGADGAISALEAATAVTTPSKGLADDLARAAIAGAAEVELARAGAGARVLLGIGQADAALRAATLPDGRVDLTLARQTLAQLPTESWVDGLVSDVSSKYASRHSREVSDHIGGLVPEWYSLPATELTQEQRASVLDGLAAASASIRAEVASDQSIAADDLRRLARDAIIDDSWCGYVIKHVLSPLIPKSPLLEQLAWERSR